MDSKWFGLLIWAGMMLLFVLFFQFTNQQDIRQREELGAKYGVEIKHTKQQGWYVSPETLTTYKGDKAALVEIVKRAHLEATVWFVISIIVVFVLYAIILDRLNITLLRP